MTQTKKFTSLDLADFMKKVKKMEKGEKLICPLMKICLFAIMNLISMKNIYFLQQIKLVIKLL
jgi:hypothetical protein